MFIGIIYALLYQVEETQNSWKQILCLPVPLYEDCRLDFSTEWEHYPFSCDKTLIQRAIMNLIYNAIVHNPKDTHVQIEIKKEQERVQIIIEDNGVGIAEEELENLFTRYYRGTNTGETHKGSGLGTGRLVNKLWKSMVAPFLYRVI